jgi:hypothetical protein
MKNIHGKSPLGVVNEAMILENDVSTLQQYESDVAADGRRAKTLNTSIGVHHEPILLGKACQC